MFGAWCLALGVYDEASTEVTDPSQPQQQAHLNPPQPTHCSSVWCLVFGVWCLVLSVDDEASTEVRVNRAFRSDLTFEIFYCVRDVRDMSRR